MGKFGQHCFGIFGSTKVCFTALLSYVPANSHPSGQAQAPAPASHSDLGGNEGRRMLLPWSCSSVLSSLKCLPSTPSSIFDGVWERASFCCRRFALLDKMFSFSYLFALGFLQLRWVGATLPCSMQASRCCVFSCCAAQALAQASVALVHGLRCSEAWEIFLGRDWTHVPCIGRWILIQGSPGEEFLYFLHHLLPL